LQPEDKYFEQLTQDELWKRYCGFLDFSVAEFMEVQEQLLLDQIDRVWSSTLGRKVMVDRNLKAIDVDYRDLESYLGLQPVRVTLLPRRSFQRYMDQQRAAGADLAHLKPPHINPSERALSDLMEPARTGGEAV